MKRAALALAILLITLTAVHAEEVAAPATPAQTPAIATPYASNSVFPAQGFSALADKLLPAVVNISSTQTVKEKDGGTGNMPDMPQFPPGSPFEEFFKDFMDKNGQGMEPGMPHVRKTTSLGSGFIIDPSGYIVTNNHVIDGADEVNVILHDDTSLKAKIIGRDTKTDLALLKVSASKPLPAVSFGDSDKMRVGDWILVIGNPFGLGGTVTQGIISARARDINSGPYDDYIQTDAPINRGNSGGPMFNLQGEVIGINTAIFSPSGGSVGIGFAIPSAMAKNVIDQLKTSGKIARGWLGVRIQNVTEEIASSLGLAKAEGALVSSVTPDSPASKAGLKQGDVLLSFDGKPINEMRRLPRMVAEAGLNREVPLSVWRDGKNLSLKVKIGEMKEDTAENDTSGDGQQDEKAPAAPKAMNIPELDAKFAPLTADARRMYSIDDNSKGVVLISMGDNCPLLDKGLRPGDLVVEAAQKEMKEPKDLAAVAKEAFAAKKSLLLLVDHKGDLRFVGVNPLDAATTKKDGKGGK